MTYITGYYVVCHLCRHGPAFRFEVYCVKFTVSEPLKFSFLTFLWYDQKPPEIEEICFILFFYDRKEFNYLYSELEELQVQAHLRDWMYFTFM